ncbi:MAG: chemoreceptor glutamine deamidase CheD [Treponema sp.]|jgi:chemotaxis protein CheD|nr:chemoreceptor glutamine deamidase CheD [Treponema sp.]
MNIHFDTHFKKQIITILPGEFFSTDKDVLISTLLGSCISIAIFDPENKSGGLNHFMLPTTNRIKEISSEEQGRYGNFAIELLINDMLKKGSKKENLTAKIFGGSNVLDDCGYHPNSTGVNNILFALDYLSTEKIPITANDTGGIFPRKIFYNPRTAKIFLKRIQRSDLTLKEIKQRESIYKEKIQNEQIKAGDITWF